MHSHPTFYWEELDVATYTDDYDGAISYTPAAIAMLAAGSLRKVPMSGVTTLRDTGSVDDIMYEVRRAARKGHIPILRLYICGRFIISRGGHCHNLAGLSDQADSPWGFRKAVREEVRAGADFFKLAIDAGECAQEELSAGVDEAHRPKKNRLSYHLRAFAKHGKLSGYGHI